MSGWPGWPRCRVLYTATLPKRRRSPRAEVLNTVQVSRGFPQNFEHDSGSRVSGDQQLPLRRAGIPTSPLFRTGFPKRPWRFEPDGFRLFRAGFPPSFSSDIQSFWTGHQSWVHRGSRRVSPVSRGFPSQLFKRHPVSLRQPGWSLRPSHLAVLWLAKK